jgi:anaerobic ribonucleoside-triphosphate reductase activating protein
MNYHAYYPLDVVNGPGTRCTLFVSGCEHHCDGCYNASTWDPASGQPCDAELTARILADLKDTRIIRRGLSLTGGDPLLPANCSAVAELCRRIKTECPEKDIWLWTGYRHESLNPAQHEVVQHIDVIVDGPFIPAKADLKLRFRGSSNQRIIELNKVC